MLFKDMKGISIGLSLIIVTFMLIIAIILPIFSIKIHVDREIIFETNYNNAQLTLLSLLSSTEVDSLDRKIKPVSEILAEYITLDKKPDIEFLKQRLDKLTEEKIFERYKLYYVEGANEKILIESEKEIPQQKTYTYKAEVNLPLPYSDRMIEKIILVIE